MNGQHPVVSRAAKAEKAVPWTDAGPRGKPAMNRAPASRVVVAVSFPKNGSTWNSAVHISSGSLGAIMSATEFFGSFG